MSLTSSPAPTALAVPRQAWRLHPARRFLRRYPMGAAGGVVVAGLLLMALFAVWVAPFNPVVVDFGSMFRAPGRAHWFGTDAFGRDVLSRIIHGARTAFIVGFGSSVTGATIGAVVGVASAYFGGYTDLIVQRFVDILISFPIIILALSIVAIIGAGTGKLIVAIALSFLPRAQRVVRSSALAVREMVYIDAARALGAAPGRIIFKHMAPNVTASYLVMLTTFLGQAILLEASLSFLGLGVSEPTPAWGLMLRGGAVDFVQKAPWMAIFPGLAISVTVLAFNVLGDALRDALDPRLRG